MVRTMFDFLALAILRQFVASGTLSLTLPGGSVERLDSGVPGADAVITLHDRATLWRLVAKPDLAFGEAYMEPPLARPTDAVPWQRHGLVSSSQPAGAVPPQCRASL